MGCEPVRIVIPRCAAIPKYHQLIAVTIQGPLVEIATLLHGQDKRVFGLRNDNPTHDPCMSSVDELAATVRPVAMISRLDTLQE